jgi:hypothetical protein
MCYQTVEYVSSLILDSFRDALALSWLPALANRKKRSHLTDSEIRG